MLSTQPAAAIAKSVFHSIERTGDDFVDVTQIVMSILCIYFLSIFAAFDLRTLAHTRARSMIELVVALLKRPSAPSATSAACTIPTPRGD